EDLRALPPAAAVVAEVRRRGSEGTTLQSLSQLSALATPRIVELLQSHPVVITRSGVVVWRQEMEHLLSGIPSLLARNPTGLSREKLLSVFAGTGHAVLEAALGRLFARGAISQRGTQLFIPRPHEDQARARDEAELALRIAETLRCSGLTPPNTNT